MRATHANRITTTDDVSRIINAMKISYMPKQAKYQEIARDINMEHRAEVLAEYGRKLEAERLIGRNLNRSQVLAKVSSLELKQRSVNRDLKEATEDCSKAEKDFHTINEIFNSRLNKSIEGLSPASQQQEAKVDLALLEMKQYLEKFANVAKYRMELADLRLLHISQEARDLETNLQPRRSSSKPRS